MEENVIYAAGGIVWKKMAGKDKIAIVYRQRHGDEWSLPKGKLEGQESWEEAAMREVEEEIGEKVNIINYAGTIDYMVNGTPKVVIFWHMDALGKSKKSTDKEVVDVKWMTVDESRSQLSFKEEKKLLKEIDRPNGVHQKPAKKTTRIRTNWGVGRYLSRLWTGQTRLRRIQGDLNAFQEELEWRIKNANSEGKDWAKRARNLVEKSEAEIANGNIEVAWKTFHAAKRLNFFGMEKEEIFNQSNTIRIEAAKLNEWRRKAVYEILGDPDHPKTEFTPAMLMQAALLRDEHYNNRYYKNQLIRNTYSFLIIFLFFVLGGILFFLYHFRTALDGFITLANGVNTIPSEQFIKIAYGVTLFGLLGGCTSAILKISEASNVSRIPEIMSNKFITTIRVFVGAALAFVILIFLESDFFEIIFSIEATFTKVHSYFAIAFVAGFTERLVLRAVTAVAGK